MTVISSVVPQIIDALIAQCPDVVPDGVSVLDVQAITGDTNNFVMVGVSDLDPTNSTTSAASTQGAATAGTDRSRSEEGDVYLFASAWSGDTNAKTSRDQVYAIADSLATMCRTNPYLEVGGVPAVPALAKYGQGLQFGADTRFDQWQAKSGAVATLAFSLHFIARI